MSKAINKAVAEIERLPEADQEKIGRGLLSHVEKLKRLRAAIDEGISSLDAGRGESLDIDRFVSRMRKGHGAA
jgi:Arc/MetJ-type ribon-helix-helix transcriptional regulator